MPVLSLGPHPVPRSWAVDTASPVSMSPAGRAVTTSDTWALQLPLRVASPDFHCCGHCSLLGQLLWDPGAAGKGPRF